MKAKNRAIIEILLCSALWSTAGLFIKRIPYPAIVIAGLRSVLAGAVAAVYMLVRRRKIIINRRTLAGAAALAATLVLFVSANKLTTAANAIVLQFTNPIFIMLISALLFHKRFSRADVVTVAVTLAGIALFFLDGLSAGNTLGNIIALLSGLAFGSYYVSLGGSSEDEHTSSIVLGNVIVFLISIPFIAGGGVAFTGESLAATAFLGVFQLGIPYVLLARGSVNCPPLVCALLGAIEPLLNPLWVLIFDGEKPGALALVGAAIVICAISAWCVYNSRHEVIEA